MRPIFKSLCLLFAAVFFGGSALPAGPVKSTGPQNFDLRVEAEPASRTALAGYRARSTAAVAQGGAAQPNLRQAAADLASRTPGLKIDWNAAGYAPEVVGTQDGQPLTAASAEPRATVARSFVSERASLFGLSTAQAAALVTAADYENPSGNMGWVVLRQEINGIPVFQGEIQAGFTKDGRIVRTTGNLAPLLDAAALPTTPGLAPGEAAAMAAGTLGYTIDPNSLKPTETSGRSAKLPAGPFVRAIETELVYFPLDAGLATLAYSMVLWEKTQAYYILVDASSGQLLWRKNITNDQTQSATYNIYNDDSPSPLSPTNLVPGSGTQPATIARTSVTLISELPAFDDLGWLTDGATTTTGNNVDAGLDLVSPDGIDTGARPVAADRNFTFAYSPPPGGTDAPSLAAYRNGVVTNLFFWTNRYHDRLYSLGFTEAARNFQTNNFNRGGVGNDAVSAQAQDYSGTNNANFSTPADGSPGRMQMYLFTSVTPNRDGSLDADVFLHELTHGLSNRLHANGSGLGSTQAGGMGEGWSDFYARCLLSTADENVDGIYAAGAYVTYKLSSTFTDNYYYGIRRFPYAVKSNVGSNGKPHNPLTFADIDPAQINLTDGAYSPSPIVGGGGAAEVHNIGEVWCMMLLEMRARLIHALGYATGNQRALQLVTDAMKLDPASPNFLQARDSIVAADNASNGGADVADIRIAFALRGLGASASTTGISTVVESFLPDLQLGAVTWSDSLGNNNGIAEPGEDLVFTVPITNVMNSASAGVTATIGKYVANYGSVAAGATVTRTIAYTVPATTVCGSVITVPLVFKGPFGSETRNTTLQTGTPTYGLTETFDSVTAPALPSGWTTTTAAATNGVAGTPWKTVTSPTVDAGNSAFAPDSAGNGTAGGETSLVSPSIAITASGTALSFKHSYGFEQSGGNNWDGGVLEIKIGTGAFTDIVTAGGSFVQNGYGGTILNQSTKNPLSGRQGWVGGITAAQTVIVNLPASATSQTVQFRWRIGFDDSVASTGWNVDTVALITGYACASVDTDGDGMQDGYEIANGLDPNDATDAAKDKDGDGMTNLQEYLAVTDPRDPTSRFTIASAAPVVNGTSHDFVVTVPSVSGKTYQLERKDELTDALWTPVGNSSNGTGASLPLTDVAVPTDKTHRFYRVRIIP